MAKQEHCKKCNETAYYDVEHDFINADESEETATFHICRLCGNRRIIKPRMTQKKRARTAKQDEMSRLMADLISDDLRGCPI